MFQNCHDVDRLPAALGDMVATGERRRDEYDKGFARTMTGLDRAATIYSWALHG
jgi:hypothetical protein